MRKGTETTGQIQWEKEKRMQSFHEVMTDKGGNITP